MIKSKPHYWLECDQAECTVKSTDGGEYGAWSDLAGALDEAQDSDNFVVLDNGHHYCAEHGAAYRCSPCGDTSDTELPEFDGERMCPSCADIRRHVLAGRICRLCWNAGTAVVDEDGQGWCTRCRHGRAPTHAKPAPVLPRTWSSYRISWGPGRKRTKSVRMKRACSGCGRTLGDVHPHEMAIAINRGPLPDTTRECGCADAALPARHAASA